MVRRGGYGLPVDTENESLRCHILIGRENAEQTFLSGPSDTIPIPIPLHDIQQTKSVQYMSQDPPTKFQRHLHYPKRISRAKKKIKAPHNTRGKTKLRSGVQGSNSLCSVPPFQNFFPTRPDRLSSTVSNVGFPGLTVTSATLVLLL